MKRVDYIKRFAVILSGCGVSDGSEIHEAALTLLYIRKAGCCYAVFAPDMEQFEVIDHFSGTPIPEKRNVLAEAGRIARKNIQPLDKLNPEEFDAIILPGGYGVAKNLSNYNTKGANFDVNPELTTVLIRACEAKKPLGAICIAPLLMSKILPGCKITLGGINDASKAAEANKAIHVVTTHGEVVFDEKYNLFSTPAYMLDADIEQVAEGIENLVGKILEVI